MKHSALCKWDKGWKCQHRAITQTQKRTQKNRPRRTVCRSGTQSGRRLGNKLCDTCRPLSPSVLSLSISPPRNRPMSHVRWLRVCAASNLNAAWCSVVVTEGGNKSSERTVKHQERRRKQALRWCRACRKDDNYLTENVWMFWRH